MSRFRHIKQNSIAEIVSTMESFLCKGYKKDIFAVLLTIFSVVTAEKDSSFSAIPNKEIKSPQILRY